MAAAPSVQDVGEAFTRKYYSILQHSPETVYQFYARDELMFSTTRMNAINEKIESYKGLEADVKFVDAEESYNGGVIILVNGSMVNEDDSRRNFSQTFFLAPHDYGYYLLNDIFRYVNNNNDVNPDCNQQDGGISSVTLDQEPPVIEDNHISEQSNEEKEALAEVADEPVQESWVLVESSTKEPVAEVDGTPKES